VCNKLRHPAIIPEQGASKIVKISQQMVKLCRKLKGHYHENIIFEKK